jgi:hypothetical protein
VVLVMLVLMVMAPIALETLIRSLVALFSLR